MNASRKTYQDTLPKKRMGAGCLFFDAEDRVMLVSTSYKPVWEIPGGVVEHNESPRECCQREVWEEIGLQIEVGHLLVVDYNAETEEKTESLMFIFDGGVLSEADLANIRLQDGELTGFQFFPIDDLPQNMTVSLRQRIIAAWQQEQKAGGIYLEDQLP